MVVSTDLFLQAILALGQPPEVFFEPFANGSLVPRVPTAGFGQEFHTLNGANESSTFNHAGGASDVEIADSLRVFKARGHARFRIDKPGIDEKRGSLAVTGVIEEIAGYAKTKDGITDGIESGTV